MYTHTFGKRSDVVSAGWEYVGGTACLTSLVYYGLMLILRRYLSNAAN